MSDIIQNKNSTHQDTDGELVIDLSDLARFFWQRKNTLLIAMLIGAVLLAAISFNMRNVYQTQVLLTPAQNDTGSMSQLAGRFGGLASLAGIDIGGRGDQLANEGVAIFTSRDFLLKFVHDRNLKPVLFYKKWDKKLNQWKKPGPIARALRKIIPKTGNKPTVKRYADPREPTDWATYRLFKGKFINVAQDKKTSLITVTVSAYKPQDAMDWAAELVKRVNEHLRQAKKNEAEKSIAYLEAASQQTNIVEMKTAIYQLIETQTKTIMLANVKEEFVFKTLDPAFYPEQKTSPKRGLMIVGGAFAGLLIATVLLFIRYGQQRQRAAGSLQEA